MIVHAGEGGAEPEATTEAAAAKPGAAVCKMRTATGKGNDARKILTFYRVNFGIHPAYKVLCDAPIIHASIQRSIFLKDSLTKLLGATAYPVVTKCIVEELRSLGKEFGNAAVFAGRSAIEPCPHADCMKSAAECIASFMDDAVNKRKVMLATNDFDVVRTALERGSIPVITIANQTRLVLRKPTAMAIENVQSVQEEKGAMLRLDDRALLEEADAARQVLRPRKFIERKRKRAKGPNPLSVKKGKAAGKVLSEILQQAESNDGGADGGEKRKGRGRRRRKRKPNAQGAPAIAD